MSPSLDMRAPAGGEPSEDPVGGSPSLRAVFLPRLGVFVDARAMAS